MKTKRDWQENYFNLFRPFHWEAGNCYEVTAKAATGVVLLISISMQHLCDMAYQRWNSVDVGLTFGYNGVLSEWVNISLDCGTGK